MIQFLRFDKSKEFDAEYKIFDTKEAVKFFLKSGLLLLIFIYSTLFLAVAIPFVKTPCLYIYFIGGIATVFYFIRFLNYLAKYIKYRGGHIRLNNSFIEVKSSDNTIKIPADEVTYLELNILGSLLIRDKYTVTSFPRFLLKNEERNLIPGFFQDMAPKRTVILKKIWEFIDAIVVALVLAVHIIQYVIQAYNIPSGSMKETLQEGDHLFVEKITYGPIIPRMMGMDKPVHLKFLSLRDLRRGDIIIFTPPVERDKDKDYIKRCIALPGDEFHIKDDHVYINGIKQDEPYTLGKPTDYFHCEPNRFTNIEGIVPPGKVVVLGDNRTDSSDGRCFGYLDITAIKGKAFILYWNSKIFSNGEFKRLGLIR
jgi:signal peptidase I